MRKRVKPMKKTIVIPILLALSPPASPLLTEPLRLRKVV